MRSCSVIFIVCAALSASYAFLPGVSADGGADYAGEHVLWFDSLNASFVGNWPFGSSYAIDLDISRNLAFCGSGGGVYILDILDPTNPVLVSDLTRTRGFVYGLFFDASTSRLYVADGQAGLDIWDLTDETTPTWVGNHDSPGFSYDVEVIDTLAIWLTATRV